jgi:hypothetical protein
MTRDEILGLSGMGLDAKVSEHVMGLDPLYHTTFCGLTGTYNGRRYSTDPSLLEVILDRMIALGYDPLLDHADDGWMVTFRKGNKDVAPVMSKGLLEAVCKCSLLAVGA